MGKLPHRRMKPSEQDHTGCMWGFISMFDFRRGGYNHRLLPDKRFGNRVLCGAGLSSKMARNLKETDYHHSDDDCASTQPMLSVGKPSVKKLMEQDMVVEDHRNHNANGVENGDSDFECQSHKKSRKLHQQKHKHFSISSVAELEDYATCWYKYLSLIDDDKHQFNAENVLQEIFNRIQQKRGDGVVHENDHNDDFCVLSEKKQAKYEKQLTEAAEVILREKLPLGQDKQIHHSREFLTALETLIPHKLLFFKLLEDPNSEMTRRINYILNAEQGKNIIQKDYEGSRSRKLRLFSRRRAKSQEVIMLTENEGIEAPSSCDILDIKSEALSASDAVTNSVPSLKTKSIFSFTEIKRKLKHIIGKDKDGVLAENVVKKVSRGSQLLRPSGETVVGRMSPSRNPHLEADVHPKRLSSPRKSEVDSPLQQKISNSFVDPTSKHGSLMLINDDCNQKYYSRQDMELERMSSSSSGHTSPNFSHSMESNSTSPTTDKRMSSPRKSFNSNEDSEGLKQDKYVNTSDDISAQSSMVTSSETNDSCSSKLESWDRSPIISKYKAFSEEFESQCSMEISPEGDTIDLIFKIAEVTPQKLKTDEPTDSPPFRGAVKFEAITRVIETVIVTGSCEKVKNEENCTALSQITLANGFLGSDKTELFDDVTSKMEKPSPISVLEPIYSEDDTSPSRTKISQGGLPVAPLQIHFNEDDLSESDKNTLDQKSINDNESKRKHILKTLKLSCFSWDTIYLRSLSSEQLLDASLYDADIDTFSDQPSNEYKMLFDCLNEVLMDSCARYFGGCPLTSPSKQTIRPIPNIENTFKEIWQGVEWHLRPLAPPRSLEQMVEKDLAKDERWMDLRFDAETISSEIEHVILQEVLEDTVLSCFTVNTEY